MAQIFTDEPCAYGGSVCAESEGFHLSAIVERDDYYGAPWEEHDGHGPVSEWTTRAKLPGEMVINRDGNSYRYYDYAEACKIARRDGWNAKPYDVEGETPRQRAAKAAMADYQHLKGWCDNDWFWCSVIVTASRDGVELGAAALSGIESEASDYLREVANEIAGEAIDEAKARLSTLCDCKVGA